jgi:hypothetical protein
MNCPNCSGLLQLGATATSWLCAWCGRSGSYAYGPVLKNGKQWRVCVTDNPGKTEHHRPWVPAESMSEAERRREEVPR